MTAHTETNQKIDDIIAGLWKKELTATQISAELRYAGYILTRCAVIGRAHRMQGKGILVKRKDAVPRKPKAIASDTTVELGVLTPTRKRFIPDRVIRPEMISAKQSRHFEARLLNKDTGEGVSFMKVKDSQCKWIMDYKRDGLSVCCGHDVMDRSLCEKHYRMSYVKPEKRSHRNTWFR